MQTTTLTSSKRDKIKDIESDDTLHADDSTLHADDSTLHADVSTLHADVSKLTLDADAFDISRYCDTSKESTFFRSPW